MGRQLRFLLCVPAAIAVAAAAAACGSANITVANNAAMTTLHNGAMLFNQRCAGCHTLDAAAARGSAANARTSQYNNGPNLNKRCERPMARVLYAIENGGFSGAIMPQNIVTGQEAMEVARFVATYAGSQSTKTPGTVQCSALSLGRVPTALQVASSGGRAAGSRGGAGAPPAGTTSVPSKGASPGGGKGKSAPSSGGTSSHP